MEQMMENRIDVFIENSIKGDFIMAELRTDFVDIKGLEFNDPKWNEGWNHNRKLKRINKGIVLKSLGIFFLDRGFTHILVGYEGSGDSGEAFAAEGYKDNEFQEIDGAYGLSENFSPYGDKTLSDGKNRQSEVRELFGTYRDLNPHAELGRDDYELEYILSDMINYDWYNNEGGGGTVVWDLKKEKIKVEGHQYYHGSYDCEETYSLNGEEPKSKYKDGGH